MLLRLPGRALGALEDLEPDRVDLFDREAQDKGHQGSGLRAAGLAMAFKLIEAAEDRDTWTTFSAPTCVLKGK